VKAAGDSIIKPNESTKVYHKIQICSPTTQRLRDSSRFKHPEAPGVCDD
jgi:hypothetical protein